ncbi:MAG: diacylglycerol kinase [Planctomycetes bacterium]|nr:diacylglycerol kinase [Planctomycetota bacterium]
MLDLLRRAPARFWKSFGYCWDGLKDTFIREESFRLETIGLAALTVVVACSGWEWWKGCVMVGSYLLIPLVELLNSAIEDICDLVTRDQAPLVKSAKDKGAMAVLMAIIVNILVLAALLGID